MYCCCCCWYFIAKLCSTLLWPHGLARQASLSMGFSLQKYWSGLLFASPWDLPESEIKHMSPALVGGFFITEPPEKACSHCSVQFNSVTQSFLTLCNPKDCSTPGLPVHHQLPEFTQTHVHWVCDTIQPSHTLSSPSPPAFNLSQHQGLFQWVSSSRQVAKVLAFQLFRPSNEHPGLISFRMNWLDLLCSTKDSQESSPTPQFKSINSLVLSPLYSPTLTPIHEKP